MLLLLLLLDFYVGCNSNAKMRGLCKRHGAHGECRLNDCSTNAVGRGLCAKHGGRKTAPCSVDGCKNIAHRSAPPTPPLPLLVPMCLPFLAFLLTFPFLLPLLCAHRVSIANRPRSSTNILTCLSPYAACTCTHDRAHAGTTNAYVRRLCRRHGCNGVCTQKGCTNRSSSLGQYKFNAVQF